MSPIGIALLIAIILSTLFNLGLIIAVFVTARKQEPNSDPEPTPCSHENTYSCYDEGKYITGCCDCGAESIRY